MSKSYQSLCNSTQNVKYQCGRRVVKMCQNMFACHRTLETKKELCSCIRHDRTHSEQQWLCDFTSSVLGRQVLTLGRSLLAIIYCTDLLHSNFIASHNHCSLLHHRQSSFIRNCMQVWTSLCLCESSSQILLIQRVLLFFTSDESTEVDRLSGKYLLLTLYL